MKLTPADITPNRVKFNSHKSHNPYCDILELKISKDAFITYCLELESGCESMEYYKGENYVADSEEKSRSYHYSSDNIPKKYRYVWSGLREYYNKNYNPVVTTPNP